MRFSILSSLALLVASVMADNRNITNNLGSTPAMRHSINQEQAQQIVRAAAMQVNKI
ncbi:hypothetical protein LTR66_015021, partial [Elasticomyces elasticus]